METIQWGEVPFRNLGRFEGWQGEPGAGMYVVMIRPHPDTNPGEYRALYFGEGADLSGADFFRAHPRFRCVISEAGTADKLYFASFPMPESSPEIRKKIQAALAAEFPTACNW